MNRRFILLAAIAGALLFYYGADEFFGAPAELPLALPPTMDVPHSLITSEIESPDTDLGIRESSSPDSGGHPAARVGDSTTQGKLGTRSDGIVWNYHRRELEARRSAFQENPSVASAHNAVMQAIFARLDHAGRSEVFIGADNPTPDDLGPSEEWCSVGSQALGNRNYRFERSEFPLLGVVLSHGEPWMPPTSGTVFTEAEKTQILAFIDQTVITISQ